MSTVFLWQSVWCNS